MLLLAVSSLQAALVEGFNDVTTLPGNGWALINKSAPAGLTDWFQGNTSVFNAQAGPANSYIAANFDNAAFGGDISNWLITPVVTFSDGTLLTFFTRTEAQPAAADRLEVRLSTNGASTNVGGTASSVGDFTTLVLTVNAALDPNGYPADWTQFSATLSGFGSPTTGRVAFRYSVPDTSTNADYIGIDTVSLTDTPEPATGGMFMLGFVAVGYASNRRRQTI